MIRVLLLSYDVKYWFCRMYQLSVQLFDTALGKLVPKRQDWLQKESAIKLSFQSLQCLVWNPFVSSAAYHSSKNIAYHSSFFFGRKDIFSLFLYAYELDRNQISIWLFGLLHIGQNILCAWHRVLSDVLLLFFSKLWRSSFSS